MEVANQKDEKNKPIIRDQTYFNCDKLLAIYFFFDLFFWFVLKKINKPPCGHGKLNMQKSSVEVAVPF